jgi:hypothetical protein
MARLLALKKALEIKYGKQDLFAIRCGRVVFSCSYIKDYLKSRERLHKIP